jgi:hypothetical protein
MRFVVDGMTSDMVGGQIQAGESARWESAGDPEDSKLVLVELADLWPERDVPYDLSCIAVKFVEATTLRYPEPPLPVFRGEFYVVTTDA